MLLIRINNKFENSLLSYFHMFTSRSRSTLFLLLMLFEMVVLVSTSHLAQADNDPYVTTSTASCSYVNIGWSRQCSVSGVWAYCFTAAVTGSSVPLCSSGNVRTSAGTVYPQTSCSTSLQNHARLVQNSCTGTTYCDNAPLPDPGTYTLSTCHYVGSWQTWTSCDSSGLQYGSSPIWNTVTGTTCTNAASVRTCKPTTTLSSVAPSCNGVDSRMTLSYSANGGASEYDIRYCSGSSSCTPSTSLVNSVSQISYVHTGLTAGSMYRYQVRASNVNGYGSWSNILGDTAMSCSAAPSGSISATSCTIQLDESSCDSTVSWNSSNFVGAASVSQASTGTTLGTSPASIAVNFSNNTFTLVDTGSSFTTSATASVSCASGVWDGSKCSVACVPLTCNASSICRGESCNPGCSLPVVDGTKNCSQPWVEVQP